MSEYTNDTSGAARDLPRPPFTKANEIIEFCGNREPGNNRTVADSSSTGVTVASIFEQAGVNTDSLDTPVPLEFEVLGDLNPIYEGLITEAVDAALPEIDVAKPKAASTIRAIAERRQLRAELTDLLQELLSTPYRADIKIPEHLQQYVGITVALLRRVMGLEAGRMDDREALAQVHRNHDAHNERRAEAELANDRQEAMIEMVLQNLPAGLLEVQYRGRTRDRQLGVLIIKFDRQGMICEFRSTDEHTLTFETGRVKAVTVGIDANGITAEGLNVIFGRLRYHDMTEAQIKQLPPGMRKEIFKLVMNFDLQPKRLKGDVNDMMYEPRTDLSTSGYMQAIENGRDNRTIGIINRHQ